MGSAFLPRRRFPLCFSACGNHHARFLAHPANVDLGEPFVGAPRAWPHAPHSRLQPGVMSEGLVDVDTAQPRRAGSSAAGRPPRSPAAKPARHSGPLDPRAVPCSMLGVKDIHGARTMGPPSGAELVSPTKRMAPHEKEPRLPPREPGCTSSRWTCHLCCCWHQTANLVAVPSTQPPSHLPRSGARRLWTRRHRRWTTTSATSSPQTCRRRPPQRPGTRSRRRCGQQQGRGLEAYAEWSALLLTM